MTRILDAAVIAELDGVVLTPVILTEMFFTSGTLRLWSGYGTLNWDGNAYTGAGFLLGFSGVEETSDLSVPSAKFSLSGVSNSILALALAEDYQGKKIICRGAFLDPAGAMIGAPYVVFAGKMDVMEIQDDGTTCMVGVNAESDLVDLQTVRSSYYTAEDQKTRFPDDKGLDFIATISDVQINWGVGVTDAV